MPRPRAFDQTSVSDAVIGAFWQGGLSATSGDDVLQATGLARLSRYSGFGNKNDILRLAIDRVAGEIIGAIAGLRTLQPSPR